MLCYIGCGNEVVDIEIDPRDGKIMPCDECQRAIKACYFGLLSVEEKEELHLEEQLDDTYAYPSTLS